MLYRLNTIIFIVGLLIISFATVLVGSRAYCPMTALTVVAFISNMCLLLLFSREEEADFNSRTLFFTTLIYSAMVGTLFMFLSYYYDGDTFLFSKTDAMFYYKSSMRAVEKGLVPTLKHFIKTEPSDDWGALFIDSTLMWLLPSKLFYNAINLLTGALSAVMLFRIARNFMPDVYAFISALAYSTSSYMIFFYGTFLKESIFTFFVICAMYYFYKAILENNRLSYFFICLFIGIIVFFRPAVAAMIVAAFMAYYATIKRGHAISVFLYMGVAVIFTGAITFMIETFEHHSGGSMDKMIELGSEDNTYSGGFNYFVSLFAAVFGPFPTLFPKTEGVPITINFYGAGLTIRQFLMIPFWVGVYYIAKRSSIILLPILVFILFEVLATGVMMASLELRKVMPHIPLMYIIMFYGLYQWHEDGHSERLLLVPITFMTIGIMMLWVVYK